MTGLRPPYRCADCEKALCVYGPDDLCSDCQRDRQRPDPPKKPKRHPMPRRNPITSTPYPPMNRRILPLAALLLACNDPVSPPPKPHPVVLTCTTFDCPPTEEPQ